jgi:hypothetical protein
VKNGVFLANEKKVNILQKNFLGSNHLLQQTELKKTENKSKNAEKKCIVHEAIKI